MQQLIIDVPDELAAQVTEALRSAYPSVVGDAETDGQAMRRVVAWWTANLLAGHAAEQARLVGVARVAAAQAALEAACTAAQARAWAAVEAAMLPSGVPSEVPPEGE